MDAPYPPGPRTVLVVEDDDATRAFLLDNLAADGFKVAGASGAGEGLRAIEVRQPALVVLDLLLDDGSGFALLDRVRAADGSSSRIDPDLPDEATKGFLADNLAADGFRVASAGTAAEGLRAIEVRRPALVLLDLRLEGGSGLDVLDRVRAADGLATRIDPDLPVIVLTGRAGEADRVRSFERGADDHCRSRRVHCFPHWRAASRLHARSTSASIACSRAA